MPLSNYLPSSRISQAGVIPNAAARPASPYEGQMVYQQDTNQLLIYDGSAWAYPNTTATNPSGLELITTCTVSSTGGTGATSSNGVITVGTNNTSVTVLNAFSGTYDNYLVMVNAGTGSDGSCNLTIGTGTNNWRYSYLYANLNNSPSALSAIGATSLPYVGFWPTTGAEITIISPYISKPTQVLTAGGNSGLGQFFGRQTGVEINFTSHTQFTLTPSSAISGHVIRVYGYRN